ncbi:MAG TPA: hypothetical protein VKP52_15635 [Pseudolabrys sp.]|nr:hypothetical protein [Pseudolabrys sp.]
MGSRTSRVKAMLAERSRRSPDPQPWPTQAAISKVPLRSMRIVVKDFSVNPNDNLVASFEYAQAIALKSLDTIEGSINQSHAKVSPACAGT